MNDKNKTPTIKDFLLDHFTWIVGVLAFIVGMYVNSVISPLANRIALVERDVEVNAQDIASLQEIHDKVIENSTKLDSIQETLLEFKNSCNK